MEQPALRLEHLLTLFGRHHIGASTGALALSVYSLAALAATYPTGALAERVGLRASLVAGLALYMAQVFILMHARDTFAAVLFACCWGVGQGIITVAVQTAWPALYGRNFLGAINGLAQFAVLLGSALGPVPFGWAYAHFHAYHQVLWAMIALLGTTLVAAAAIRPPGHGRGARSPDAGAALG